MLIDIRDPDTMKINGKDSFILTKNKHAIHLKNNEGSPHVILEDIAAYGLFSDCICRIKKGARH